MTEIRRTVSHDSRTSYATSRNRQICRVGGTTSRDQREHEISWTFTPRIDPGEYCAYCRTARIYRDRQFKRWICAVQFDVLDDSLITVQARLTWYLNLGSRERPHAGRRGHFWEAWVKASGGPPTRRDRLSPRVFVRRHALVRVEDTSRNHRQEAVIGDQSYSVIRDVIEWRTGGRLR